MSAELFVEHGTTYGISPESERRWGHLRRPEDSERLGLNGDGCEGWRVGLRQEGIEAFIGVRFDREVDAKLAKRALEQAGLTTAEKLLECGRQGVARIMTDALMW